MEYINLKRALGNKDDLDTRLVSLRQQYSSIKTKVSNLWLFLKVKSYCCMHMNVLFFVCLQYDVLLKKRNQMDLDMAPLKVRKKKK